MDRCKQAFRILQFTFFIAPVLAGLDKFVYMLTDWSKYLSPMASQVIQDRVRLFFGVVGVVEILVGIGVLWKPKIFSYIVAIWLLLIIINLLMLGQFLDVALRDIGLFLAAIALTRLSHEYCTTKK